MSKYQFTTNWMSRNIDVWMEHLKDVAGKPHLQFLEIGSYEGRSAIWLLENILTDATSFLTCIDPFYWQEKEERFLHNIDASGKKDQVFIFKGVSENFLPYFPRTYFDFIYIDGDHRSRQVLEDAVFSFLLLKPGGLLVFDDYHWKLEENRPKPAIDAFLEVYQGYYELVHKKYQVVVRKCKEST